MVWRYYHIFTNIEGPTHLSQDERWQLRHVSKNYLIVDNTLYRRGVDSILTHEEAELVLNDFHRGACRGHLYGLSTAQKILRVGYFWLSIFKYYVNALKKCHPFQVFARNMHSRPTPLYRIIIVDPFTKWGLDFMDCNPALAGGASSYYHGCWLFHEMGWGYAHG